ncbi:phosphoribosylamine--glycine ligase [uncultured Ilyobacter sp.]|uniref:phosphoribosylamine--glycine ligase n=1 Tax=uncultured Ilyobacter sp. TaxID=544433 RepID=UPI0029C8923F|nr:phosphoribosylamine--glycine ligase [uncultured Ilyobacter sp.]
MKILVVGSGGREHAICWKIQENKNVEKIYCAPGNAGIELLEKVENVELHGMEDIVAFAEKEKIDLTMVGSEELLVAGIVDRFKEKGLKIFGPDSKAALLEGSKAYAKDFMKKYGVKTAAYEIFTDADKAKAYLETINFPVVIKASGLAAGKGVLICADINEGIEAVNDIMVDKKFNDAGNEVVIEEFLEGVEASILSITDSKQIVSFISAKDHKKIGEGDTGLNTGGMGVIAPNPYVTSKVYDQYIKDIVDPTLKGIKSEGLDFCGVIFFGLMINSRGVYLLEYNMRMGDPETQVVLPLLESDYLNILNDTLLGELDGSKIKWKNESACCIVAASGGYPEAYDNGYEITGCDAVSDLVFMAGVKKEDKKFVTAGGRVLNVVALGKDLDDAKKNAYNSIGKIKFDKMYYRRDIGKIN